MGAPLIGVDSRVWGDKDIPQNRDPDLVAVRTRLIEDPFSRMVVRLVHPFYPIIRKQFKSKSSSPGIQTCEDERLRRFARYITTLLASAILVGSINALYFISSMVARLGAVSAFNILFAFCLLIFAKGKPIEVFSTTSA